MTIYELPPLVLIQGQIASNYGCEQVVKWELEKKESLVLRIKQVNNCIIHPYAIVHQIKTRMIKNWHKVSGDLILIF